jgi:hypothetical protein
MLTDFRIVLSWLLPELYGGTMGDEVTALTSQSKQGLWVMQSVEQEQPVLDKHMHTNALNNYVTQFTKFRTQYFRTGAYTVFGTCVWLMVARFQLSTGLFVPL